MIEKRERPVLWFSTEEFWEPTASKAWLENGVKTDLDMHGTYQCGGGLARFGVSVSRLVPWPALGRKANIPPRIRVSLEQVARKKGACPDRWYGLIAKPLLVQEVEAIHIFDGQHWVSIGRGEDDDDDDKGTIRESTARQDARE